MLPAACTWTLAGILWLYPGTVRREEDRQSWGQGWSQGWGTMCRPVGEAEDAGRGEDRVPVGMGDM